MNKATLQYISDHADSDPLQLLLSAHCNPEVDVAFAVRQLSARQRIRYKLPEFYANPEVEYPQQLALEQCSSEQTATHKAGIVSGNLLVDLTGGFGVDFYYMAQKMKESIYVERQPELCELAVKNFKLLGLTDFKVFNSTAADFLTSLQQADWIYIDPHRRANSGRKTVLISDCEPDLNLLAPELLNKGTNLLVKLSPMLDLHRALQELPYTKQVDIIAVDNECKELLFVINKSKKGEDDILIRCFNYRKNKSLQLMEFRGIKDSSATVYCSEPLEYLYEPNVALLKSGAYNRIAERFKLLKFHANTHLYTSSDLIADFPGRVFKVIDVKENSKQTYTFLKSHYPAATISARNFVMSSEELRRKTQIKDGSDWYLFAFKNAANKNLITVCKKITGVI